MYLDNCLDKLEIMMKFRHYLKNIQIYLDLIWVVFSRDIV